MADKFQALMDAALTGDRAAVDKVLAENPFSFFELLALPGQFDALPKETKAELAGVYQQHPDILPDAAKPYVDKALEGITPSAPHGSASAAPAGANDVVASIPTPRLRPDQPAATTVPATAGGTGNIFKDFIQSQSVPIDVRNAIADQTTTEGMTPRAIGILQAATDAAAAAGLSRLDIVAAKGTGHLSHLDGTEWDLVGRNADGSIWSNEQRVAVAQGARDAGADRFGLYDMNKGLGAGTIHIGYSHTSPTTGQEFVPAVWGANGLTTGAAAQRFNNPADRAFMTAYSAGKPYQSSLPATAAAYAPAAPAKAIPAVAAVNAVATGQPLPPIPQPRPGQPPAAVPPRPELRPADLSQLAGDIQDGRRYRKGAEGDDVRQLQRFLNASGATDDRGNPLKEDGAYGNATRQAVKDFQRSHPELVVDGVVGPRTLAAMERDQTQMQQAASERPYNDLNAPKLLTSLAVTDPISDQMWAEVAKAGAAALAYSQGNPMDMNSPAGYYAANVGQNLGGFMVSPRDFNASLPGSNQSNPWSNAPAAQENAWTLHPGQAAAPTGTARQVFNELTLGRDQPIDSYRGIMGYGSGGGLGSDTNTNTGEIVYNATAAAARRLMEGPPGGNGSADPASAEPFFIPPPDGVATPIPTAGATAGATPIGGGDPNDPSTWPVVDGISIPPEGTMAPPADDNLIQPVGSSSGGNSTVDDLLANHSPADIVPSLSTDDASTLFDPQPYDPGGSGSLMDNPTDPYGGAAG